MSVFRRLSAVGYLSSCSHAGRYYTLRELPQFDEDGLWFCQGIIFSRHGTLKETVAHLVEVAEDGRTHPELQMRLGLRVQNSLLDLIEERRIGREPFARQYLYVSADQARAQSQVSTRRDRLAGGPAVSSQALLPAGTIEVLVELVHASGVTADAASIAQRLQARGSSASTEQVAEVFRRYGLVKKTVPSRSRRSPR